MRRLPLTIRPALRTWLVCTVLFAGTMLLFGRSTGYGFLNYDDPSYILNNIHVTAGLTWESIVWAFTGHADYWHPLTWLSHMVDWELYGSSAEGHHLTSVAWHALNAALAFLVLRRLTGSFWTSAFAAALFAWHPLRVESVVWITERKDVMSGCFFLLTIWAYAAYAARRQSGQSPSRLYCLTLGLFLLGLMSKPMVVALPVLLLVLDYWPLRRISALTDAAAKPTVASHWRVSRGLLLEKLPFFALSLIVSLVTIAMQTKFGAFRLDLPLDARVGNAVVSLARYLGKFFWPFDLAIFYPHPGRWNTLPLLGASLLVAAVTAACWWQRRKRPWLLTGWLWFIVVLLPAIGILQVGLQAMADRYTYLSLLGVQLAVLWTWRDFAARHAHRWIAGLVGVAVLGGCVARTWNQQTTWRDSVTVFQHAIAVTRNNETAHAFLGYTLTGLGRFEEAEAQSQRALALNPRNETAWFAIAEIRERQQRHEEALAAYRTVLELNPADAQAEYRIGRLLLRLGRTDEALAQLTAVLRRRDDFRAAHFELAMTEARFGEPGRAVPYLAAALAAEPGNADVHYGMATAFAKLHRPDEALAHLRTAVQLSPDHFPAHLEIGMILLGRRESAEAARHFRAAIAAAPHVGLAHLGLGRALEQLGQHAEAVPSFERALQFAPEDPTVRRALAVSLARRGRFADAVVHYEHALQSLPSDPGLHAELGFALFFSNRRSEAIGRMEEALRLEPNFPGLRERLERMRQ